MADATSAANMAGIRHLARARHQRRENSDIMPNASRKDCSGARCGDDIKDDGEECDGGFFSHDTQY